MTTKKDILIEILKGKHLPMDKIVKYASIKGISDSTVRSTLYRDEDKFINIVDTEWILLEDLEKNPLPKEIIKRIINKNKSNRNNKITDHRIVQSILINLGKDIGYKTYIPSQDKLYLFNENEKLIDIVDTYELPDNIEDKDNLLRTVDTIWFNKEVNIKYLFEVEDKNVKKIQQKLENYIKLSEKCEGLYLIANIKEQKFKAIINKKEYDTIREKVIFLNIEDIKKFYDLWSIIKLSNCSSLIV